MPELPEVETIAANLRNGSAQIPSILEMEINKAHVFWHKTIAEPSVEDFLSKIRGRFFTSVQRRGKFIHFPLDQGHLIIHLRMSGDLYLRPGSVHQDPSYPSEQHNRTIFHLENDWDLVFHDTRKFGRIWLLDDPQQLFQKLGSEPFDTNLTVDLFLNTLNNRKRILKPLLMDQTFIAGLGNIYTDEALFKAGISPLQTSEKLRYEQADKLLTSIREVLQEGIRHNGSSIDWVYRGGDFQNHFCVYQRSGEACPRCGTAIKRIVVGQRSTHYCPICQPLINF